MNREQRVGIGMVQNQIRKEKRYEKRRKKDVNSSIEMKTEERVATRKDLGSFEGVFLSEIVSVN